MSSQLYEELRRLCRGRGLLTAHLDDSVGPLLRGLAEGRDALAALLVAKTDSLPEDLRDAARAALALHPEATQRFLRERLDWLAEHLQRDARTARRRYEEALLLLAESLEREQPAEPTDRPAEWHPELVRTLVRLDVPGIEVLEERTIVVRDGTVDQITLAMSLPAATPGASPLELGADVLFGARLAGRARPSASHFHFILDLPRKLRAGDRHTWAMRFTLSPGDPLAPHYALTPFGRCDAGTVRVRFAPGHPPRRLWLLDGVPPRVIDDAPRDLPVVELDGVGEAYRHFDRLTPGVGYGFRWEF
ncbi:hypothetical protein [Actinomadura harenae]|nr:hypothetical protein [Actinomadura harenae]